MGSNIFQAIQQCFEGLPIPTFFGASHIILVSKVEQLDSYAKFIPISLCVVAYKIFSKILVSRLTLMLPRLVSKEHGGFCQR